MRLVESMLALVPLMPQVLALPTSCGGSGAANNANGKAIYFITNGKANAVAAIPIGIDGLLKATGTLTATGGAGANGVDGATKEPAAPDPLFSQSSLTLAGNVCCPKPVILRLWY